MSQLKDPKIKLFGKTIKLPGEDSSSQDQQQQHQLPPPCCSSSSSSPVVQDCSFNRDAGEQESAKSIPCPKQDDDSTDKKEEEPAQPLTSEELKDSNVTPPTIEDSNPPSADTDFGSAKTPKPEEDQTDTSNSNEKTLKKPDKILPCPRCNSMDTKFCYFNNYNVNQPRHFCKNCQRYWTAGGTMRNVPVGAGRRKNKNSISQFRHLAVPESLHNGINHPALNPNGTVLTFSSDVPLCESMASVLNIADKTIRNGLKAEDSGDGHSSRSHISNEEVVKNGSTKVMPNVDPFAQRVPVPFPVAPWPYPLTPTLGPASYPVPFYPTPVPYWGCAVPWVIPPAPTTHTPPSSGPISPTLGKHSREDSILKPDNAEEEQGSKESGPEKSLWVPKTLRIDDPGEAAKSSIWATLGIKNETSDSVGKGGLFKAFQGQESKSNSKSHVPETSTVLQANPAALSRSLSFHESS